MHVPVVVSTAEPGFRQCHQTNILPAATRQERDPLVGGRQFNRSSIMSCLTAYTIHSLAEKTEKLTYCVETRRSKGKHGLAVPGRNVESWANACKEVDFIP